MQKQRITIDHRGIILLPVITGGRELTRYEVDPREQPPGQWLSHLRDKRWFTASMEAELIAIFANL